MVPISLSEATEYAITVSKFYGWSFDYCFKQMRYGDLTVLYAKIANEKAFEAYNNYISLDEEAKAKYVYDWGVPKPYEFEVLDPNKQKSLIEEAEKSALQKMYKRM